MSVTGMFLGGSPLLPTLTPWEKGLPGYDREEQAGPASLGAGSLPVVRMVVHVELSQPFNC